MQPKSLVAYFYFDFNDTAKQSSSKAMRSLMFQFAVQYTKCMQSLDELYRQCRDGQHQSSERAFLLLFNDAITNIENAFVVLDALDECTDRQPLLALLNELVDTRREGLRILAASRREKDIEDELATIADRNMNIESDIVNKDIHTYIRDRLASDKKLAKWSAKIRDEITTVLMQKAGGMYVWDVRSLRRLAYSE